MNVTKILVGLLVGIYLLASTSCKKEKTDGCIINIYLTDAPAAFSSLNLDLKGVRLLTEKSKKEEDFKTINSGIYDLFKYSNGQDTLIASTEIKAKKILKLRLILGENNNLVGNNGIVPLVIPTETRLSMSININKELEKEEIINLWLDIDAYRSLKILDESIIFTPKIRIFEKKKTGNVRGVVQPASAICFVAACSKTDTFGTVANSNGVFMIQGLPPGLYNLKFNPQKEDLVEGIIEDIEVKADSSTFIGTVALN